MHHQPKFVATSTPRRFIRAHLLFTSGHVESRKNWLVNMCLSTIIFRSCRSVACLVTTAAMFPWEVGEPGAMDASAQREERPVVVVHSSWMTNPGPGYSCAITNLDDITSQVSAMKSFFKAKGSTPLRAHNPCHPRILAEANFLKHGRSCAPFHMTTIPYPVGSCTTSVVFGLFRFQTTSEKNLPRAILPLF